jgi:hypothetical protein
MTSLILALALGQCHAQSVGVAAGYCQQNLQVQSYAAPVQAVAVQAYAPQVQQVQVVRRFVRVPASVVAVQSYGARNVQAVQAQGYSQGLNVQSQSYGSQNVVAANVQSGSSFTKTVTKTRTGRAGLINRILGR